MRSKPIMLFVLFALCISLAGCFTSDNPADDVSSVAATTTTDLSLIALSVSQDSIAFNATSQVTAIPYNGAGNPIPDVLVSFSIDRPDIGSITPAVTSDASGAAVATFTSRSLSGSVQVTAVVGETSSDPKTITVDITESNPPASSIEFVSAVPDSIALAGSGGNETSVIKFRVKDSNGNPVEGESVTITMKGPNGGEYIDSSGDGTPSSITVSSNASGEAQVLLNSGTVAGPVTITAAITVDGTTYTVNSSVVSIGGGVPSAKRFSSAVTVKNLPGLSLANRETTITTYLADRFGNYNILTGTTVSFVCEGGLAIDTSEVTLNEDGIASAVARTQTEPEDVAPLAWETALINYVTATYGVTFPGNPRDGASSILVYTKGEEHFDDANANGSYDSGESFIDTVDDPFCDYNDDETYTDYTGPYPPADPPDLYIDSEPVNNVWDGENGIWDDSKNIFMNYPILITGSPSIYFDAGSFTVPNSGSTTVTYIVADRNLNSISGGSTITVTSTGGVTLSGLTSITVLDTNSPGSGIEYSITLIDADGATAYGATTLKVTVEWEGSTFVRTLSGTVQ
jgi:hypothetical protein